MFSDLDLNFHIINTDKKLDDYKKKILFNNISLAREHPRQNAIEAYFSTMSDYVVLNGVGGELVRNYFGIDHPSDNLIDGEYIASEIIACPKKLAYVRIELDLWLKNNRAFAEEHKISIPNLFYWEQRMGNWGTLNRNEEDMVVESFFPWVNRKLLMLLAELPDSMRTKDNNDAFLQIISILWPELLKYPINPIKGKEKVVAFVRKVLPKKIENSIRRFLFS